MRLSISEIITKACALPTDQEKIDWLVRNNNSALQIVLGNMYNPERVKFLLPDTPPPWKKNDYVGVEGMLYGEARRIRIFVEGNGYDHLNQVKREHLFISLLEDVDNADAEMLCKMVAQKPLPGLPKEVVMAAFPEQFAVAAT